MTKEVCERVSYENLRRGYSAYNELMAVYEDTFGGPRGAMSYKEYFAVRDSRDNIRAEVERRAKEASHV